MKNTKNTKGLQTIGQIMPEALKKFGDGRNYSKYNIIINWEKIVGKEIAANSLVANVNRNTLIVKVKNSVWSHHLMMFKEDIIQKVNCYLGKNLINDIWFMAGYDKENQNYKNSETVLNVLDEVLINKVELEKSEVAAVRTIAENVSDYRIKNKIIRLISRNMALEKAKRANNWQVCLSCEVLVPPGKKYCTVCQISKNERNSLKNKKYTIEKLLKEAPWLTYNDMKKYVDSSLDEYNCVKKNLVQYYVQKIIDDNNKNIDKNSQIELTMLLKEIKPDKLTQNCIDEVISEVRKRFLNKEGGKYVFASGS